MSEDNMKSVFIELNVDIDSESVTGILGKTKGEFDEWHREIVKSIMGAKFKNFSETLDYILNKNEAPFLIILGLFELRRSANQFSDFLMDKMKDSPIQELLANPEKFIQKIGATPEDLRRFSEQTGTPIPEALKDFAGVKK